MCSIAESYDFGDEGGAHTMEKNAECIESVEEELCKKCCNEISVIKLENKEKMCVSCFFSYVRHKFRASLGSTKIVRRGSKVLLRFSGNLNDVCLLDFIRIGFEAEAYKRLCFDVDLIFIDENSTDKDAGSDAKARLAKVQEVKEILRQFPNFNCRYASIAEEKKQQLMDLNELTLENMQAIIDSEKKFLKVFNSLKLLTSKQDFLEMIRNDRLRNIADVLNCQYVFVSDIGIDLAKRLITNIALGRGASVAHDVAFCDDRIESQKFIRPLKDLQIMEVESYMKLKKLKSVHTKMYGSEYNQFDSVQNLTSQFIDGLQENYSSTVSTVYRTCSKIGPKSVSTRADCENTMVPPRCHLCKSFQDCNNSNTLYATEFSRLISEEAGSAHNAHSIKTIEERAMEKANSKGMLMENQICHGCSNIFNDMQLNCDELDLFKREFLLI